MPRTKAPSKKSAPKKSAPRRAKKPAARKAPKVKPKAAAKPAAPKLPPNYPLVPYEGPLKGEEFNARVNCKTVLSKKGKPVKRCDKQRVRVVAGATPSAEKPRTKQVIVAQKGVQVIVPKAQVARAVREADRRCEGYDERVREGLPVPSEAYTMCPTISDAPELTYGGDTSFDVELLEPAPRRPSTGLYAPPPQQQRFAMGGTQYGGARAAHMQAAPKMNHWNRAAWQEPAPRPFFWKRERYPDGRYVPLDGESVVRIERGGVVRHGRVVNHSAYFGGDPHVHYNAFDAHTGREQTVTEPLDEYWSVTSFIDQSIPMWETRLPARETELEQALRLFPTAPVWGGVDPSFLPSHPAIHHVQDTPRQPALPGLGDPMNPPRRRKMNHHQGHHEPGDPLGVYIPNAADWHPVGPPPWQTLLWAHPDLPIQLSVMPYARDGWVAYALVREPVAGLEVPGLELYDRWQPVHTGFAPNAETAVDLARRWYADLHWTPVRKENRAPRGTPPGTAYIPRTPDPYVGRHVIGDDFVGEVRANVLDADGREGYFVGGHLMSQARAAGGVRREHARRAEEAARAAAPRLRVPEHDGPAYAPRRPRVPELAGPGYTPRRPRAPELEGPAYTPRRPRMPEYPGPDYTPRAPEMLPSVVPAPPPQIAAAPSLSSRDEELRRALMEELAAAGFKFNRRPAPRRAYA